MDKNNFLLLGTENGNLKCYIEVKNGVVSVGKNEIPYFDVFNLSVDKILYVLIERLKWMNIYVNSFSGILNFLKKDSENNLVDNYLLMIRELDK